MSVADEAGTTASFPVGTLDLGALGYNTYDPVTGYSLAFLRSHPELAVGPLPAQDDPVVPLGPGATGHAVNSWVTDYVPSYNPEAGMANPGSPFAQYFSNPITNNGAGGFPSFTPAVSFPSAPTSMGGEFFNTDPIRDAIGRSNPCLLLPEGWQRTACTIAQGALGLGPSDPNKGANLSGVTETGLVASNCPTGFEVGPDGRCRQSGFSGTVSRVVPGGNTGYLMPGAAGAGMYGAIQPTQVGTISRKDGTTGPILRCPGGFVLGKDYLCYFKKAIPKTWRAHPPAARPLLSAQEGKIMRLAVSKGKKLRRIANKLSPKRASCSCKKVGARKR